MKKGNGVTRLMAAVLATVMALGLLTGCGGGEGTTTEEAPEATTQGNEDTTGEESTVAQTKEIAYPLEDGVPISWWVSSGPVLYSSYTEASESPFHMGLNKMVGLDIDWQFVPIGTTNSAAYNLLLLEDKLPTILFGTVLNVEDLYEGNLIYDLTDYLPEYAPDYWRYINENNLVDEIKSLDGRILTFNSFRGEELSAVKGVIVRQDWLDECGLEMPVTLEDWENVLTKFKDRYGAKLTAQKGKVFEEMFGLASGTGAMGGFSGLNFFVDENGNIQCAQTQDEWKELIRVLADWMDKDLIDGDITSITGKVAQGKALTGETGVMLSNEANLATIDENAAEVNNGANWVAAPYAVTEAGEKVSFINYRRPVLADVAVITKTSSEEELITALKVLNYGYTEEGMHYWNFGEEGVSFNYDENRKEQWTDVIVNDPEGVTNATKKYIGAYGAGPTCVDNWQIRIRTGELAVEAMECWSSNSDAEKYRVPTLKYTVDEESRLADLQTTIETYFTPMAQKLIRGEESLEKLDELVSEMNKLGLDELIEIMQIAYDRQK